MGYEGYAYGLERATTTAVGLRLPAFTAAELGVAGGHGLIELENMAAEQEHRGVQITVAGFDRAVGLPHSSDYRDLGYVWRGGFFTMNEPLLRERMRPETQLMIGEIEAILAAFMVAEQPPIGFLAFDLDYYSSTMKALNTLGMAPVQRFLPRVMCFFDDTVGFHDEYHCDFVGELAAIAEFNATHRYRKMAKLNGLHLKPRIDGAAWAEGIYVLHLFDHPRYSDYVLNEVDRQLPL
jgi:hypothetical protein